MIAVSRQRRWQEKKLKEGKCVLCGKPASEENKQYCEKHREQRINFLKEYRKTHKN